MVCVEDGDDVWFACLYSCFDLKPHGRIAMKRLIASVLLALALLTSGVVATQYSMVGTAYADGDSGD